MIKCITLTRFSVLVCPHAGGIGLCEYVIHLRYEFDHPTKSECSVADVYEGSFIDYILVSGSMERNHMNTLSTLVFH